jgi:hypothetical protein
MAAEKALALAAVGRIYPGRTTERAMFPSGSTDRWSWSEDAFEPLDFCVRTLVLDGLRVPPFDRHRDGDGALRAAGLNPPAWREWVEAVIRHRSALSAAAVDFGRDGDRERLFASAREAGAALQATGSLCPGSPGLQQQLNELWVAYQPLGDAWKRRMTIGEEGAPRRFAAEGQRRLWNALLPFHDRLATISVFLVDYPVPVVMALPPTACLISPSHDADLYGRQVLDAAIQLAAAV